MKVIDAFWEKRNLGVDTVEFDLEVQDPAALVAQKIKENEKVYNVVKIPAGRSDLHFLMQELGYVYVETAFHLIHDLKAIPLSPLQKRMTDCVSYQKMNEDDVAQLYAEIKKGMFTTDRIALHPSFGVEIANQRYINWIGDELSRGCELFKLIYKEKAIGFFTFKKLSDDVYYPFLAGMYESHIRSGLGVNIVIKPVEEAVKRGAKFSDTYVVTNNLSSLTANLDYGYKIRGFSTVFHKYKGEGTC